MVDKGPETSDTLSPSHSRGSSIPSSPEHVVRPAVAPSKNRELSDKPPYIPLVRFTPSNSPWRKDKTIKSSPIRRPQLSIVSSQKGVKSQSESESRLMGLLRSKSKVGNFHNVKLGKKEMPQLSRSRTVVPEFISTNKSLKVRSESFDQNNSSLANTANRTFISNVKQLLQNDRALGMKAALLNSTGRPTKPLNKIKPASLEKQVENLQVQNVEPKRDSVSVTAGNAPPIVSQLLVEELPAGQENTNEEAKTIPTKSFERGNQKAGLCIPNKRTHEGAPTEVAPKGKKAKLLDSSGDAKTVSDIVSQAQRLAAELLHGSTLERNNISDGVTKEIRAIEQRPNEEDAPNISKNSSDNAVLAQVPSTKEKRKFSNETPTTENGVSRSSDQRTIVDNAIQADDESKKIKLDGVTDTVRVSEKEPNKKLNESNIFSKASTTTTTQLASVKEKSRHNTGLSKDEEEELTHDDRLTAVKSLPQSEQKESKISNEGVGKVITVTAPEKRSTEKNNFSCSNRYPDNHGKSRVSKKSMAMFSIELGKTSKEVIPNPFIDHNLHPKTVKVVRQGTKTKSDSKVEKPTLDREQRRNSTQINLEQMKAIPKKRSGITSSKDEVAVTNPVALFDQTPMAPISIYKGKDAITHSDVPNSPVGRGQQLVMNKSTFKITKTKSATVFGNISSRDGPAVQRPFVVNYQRPTTNTSKERKITSDSEQPTSLHRDKISVHKSVLNGNLAADQVEDSIKQIGNDAVNGYAVAPSVYSLRARWNNALTEETTDDELKRQNLVDLLKVLYREKTQVEEPALPPDATGGHKDANFKDGFLARILTMREVLGDEEPDGKRGSKTRDKQHVLTEAVVSAGGDMPKPRQEESPAREDSSLTLNLHYLPDSTSSNDEESKKDNFNKSRPSKETELSGKMNVSGPESGAIPVLSRDKSAGKEIYLKQDPVIERRRINRQLAQDVMKLDKKSGYDKDRISQLIEGGVATHSSIASDPKVSVTNNICSAKNYEHSHAYYYQQMHKKGDLEYMSISGPLNANFIRDNERSKLVSREAQPKDNVLESPSDPLRPSSSQIDNQDSTGHLKEGWKRRWLTTLQECQVYIERPSSSSESYTAEQFLHLKNAFVGFGAKLVDHLDESVDIVITTKILDAGPSQEKPSNGGLKVWSVEKALQFLINLGELQAKREVKPEAKSLGSVGAADNDTTSLNVPPNNDKSTIKLTPTLKISNEPSSTQDIVVPKPAKAKEIISASERNVSPTTQNLTTPEPRVPESATVAQEAFHTTASEGTMAPKLSSFGTSALSDSATVSSHETWEEVSSDDISETEDVSEEQFVQSIIEDATTALEERDKQIEAARKLILALSREVMQKELSITSLAGRLKAAEREMKEQKDCLDDYAVALAEKEVEIVRITDVSQDESD